jgi:hypothetical protein
MNANELADDLEELTKGEYGNVDKGLLLAATMLRQQQAEIEALKAKTQYWLHTLHCSCGRHWEVTTYPPKLVEANK